MRTATILARLIPTASDVAHLGLWVFLVGFVAVVLLVWTLCCSYTVAWGWRRRHWFRPEPINFDQRRKELELLASYPPERRRP